MEKREKAGDIKLAFHGLVSPQVSKSVFLFIRERKIRLSKLLRNICMRTNWLISAHHFENLSNTIMSDGKEHENVTRQTCYIYEEKVVETVKFQRRFLGSFCFE